VLLGFIKINELVKTSAIATYKQHQHEFRKLSPTLKNNGSIKTVWCDSDSSDSIYQKSNAISSKPS